MIAFGNPYVELLYHLISIQIWERKAEQSILDLASTSYPKTAQLKSISLALLPLSFCALLGSNGFAHAKSEVKTDTFIPLGARQFPLRLPPHWRVARYSQAHTPRTRFRFFIEPST